MKKQVLLFMAGGALAFASCNQAADNNMSEAQIDSTVNARVEEIRAEMMAHNDSLINMMAQERADSIIAAMKGGTPSKSRTVVKKPVVSGGDKVIDAGTGTATPNSKSKWGQTDDDKASKSKWGKTEEQQGSKSKWGK